MIFSSLLGLCIHHVAPKEIRSQAQSMLVFITQGIGIYIGYGIVFGLSVFGWKVYDGKFGQVSGYGPLNESMSLARGEQEFTYLEKLVKMFAVDMPEKVDPNLITTAMEQWKTFWIFPAIMAAVIAVIFFLTFRDKTQVTDD